MGEDTNTETWNQPFASLAPHQMHACRPRPFEEANTSHRWFHKLLVALLHRLDITTLKGAECYYAAKCGLEMAILDFWCKLESLPLYQLLGFQAGPDTTHHVFRKGFYTAAINSNISVVIDVVHAEAVGTTRYLKIKVGTPIPSLPPYTLPP